MPHSFVLCEGAVFGFSAPGAALLRSLQGCGFDFCVPVRPQRAH